MTTRSFHVGWANRARLATIICLGSLAIAMCSGAVADAGERPSAAEIAADMGLSTAELERAAGISLSEIDAGIAGLGPQSRAGADLGGANVLNLNRVGAHDWSGGASCTATGHREAPELGTTDTWWVIASHSIQCPPLVTSSTCEVMVYFPNYPSQPTTSSSGSGNDDCYARTAKSGYGWNVHGIMRGLWSAVATVYWVNTHPRSCFSSQAFIHCAYYTGFDIPGFGEPWDTFNWPPSDG
jgi:hypothetical protein